jgi:hypothetical protein
MFAALLWVALPGVASAQSSLSQGDRIRVRYAEGRVVTGGVAAVSTQEVRLVTRRDSIHVVRRDQIDGLERSVGQERRFARDFFRTMGITATAGLVAGAVTWSPCDTCFIYPSSRGDGALVGMILGAVIGLPLGLIVGASHKHDLWEPVTLAGPGGSALSLHPVPRPDALGLTGSISVGGP